MPRRNKNGRFSRTTTTRRRRSKPKANLANIAVSLAVANAVSRNVVGLNAYDFLTAGTSLNPNRGMSGWASTGDPHRNMITLREMLAGQQTSGPSIGDAIMQNVQKNLVPLAASVILIPMAANVATKLLRKPVILPANRLLKSTGLDVKLG